MTCSGARKLFTSWVLAWVVWSRRGRGRPLAGLEALLRIAGGAGSASMAGFGDAKEEITRPLAREPEEGAGMLSCFLRERSFDGDRSWVMLPLQR